MCWERQAVHPQGGFPGNGDRPVKGEWANSAGEPSTLQGIFDHNILEVPAVIFHNGSGLVKAGITGNSGPRSIFTALVGHSKVKAPVLGAGQRECYIGEAQSKRGVLSLGYPMDHATVTCWDDMERIWRLVYEYELRIKGERPVLLTEAPLNPLQNREKTTGITFKGFMVPAVSIAVQATLALCASARTTGIATDSGDVHIYEGTVHAFPIYEGYCLPPAVSRLDVAGRDIIEYFMKLLLDSGHTSFSTVEREIVRDIKEMLCYVALDPIQMKAKPEIMTEYRLPDNCIIHVGNQLFHAPETLFLPADIGVEAPAVHKIIFNTVMKHDIGTLRNLYGNILPSGGSNTRWIGASILTCLTSFKETWVTMSDYKDFGAAVSHQKCF
ncbi:LOW QUALITY PROTEIN: actin-related protein T2 [Pluvialis apricaria]